jgi:hypothetical protein
MSWMLIFISTYVPLTVLFILILLNWLHEKQSTATPLREC